MAVFTKTVKVYACERCEHEWIPRNLDALPAVCPKCKSPYWNRPRKNQAPKNKRKR